jgi:hypothetical protein
MVRPSFIRIDLANDTAGLAPSLTAAIEAAGGLFAAGDAYASADEVVLAARSQHAVALRLDFRDLSLLHALPFVRYLHLRTDGRPRIEPIAALHDLRALIFRVGALRGEVDLQGFPELHWLGVSLGGRGGVRMLSALNRGHSRLQWLSVREVTARTASGLCHSFPQLRVLRIGFADHLRQLGPLSEVTPQLRKIALDLTQVRDLDGLSRLRHLETVELYGGRVRDLAPLASLPALRYARLELPDLESIEPLRHHPSLRMLALTMACEPDVSVLESMPNLVAVRRGRNFTQPVRWPDLGDLAEHDPLRVEWSRVMRE